MIIAAKTFTCAIENYFGNGTDLTETIIATTASKARYSFYLKLDSDASYKEIFKYIRVRTIGRTRASDFFGDKEQFNRICKSRKIEFAYQGMTIDVAGQKGIIVGGNNHNNLDVVMEGKTYSENCHPTWETTYFDKDID